MAISAQTPTFNRKLNWLLLVPPAMGVLGYFSSAFAAVGWPAIVMQGISFVLIIYLYVVQQRYIVRRYARGRSTKAHMILIGFTFVVPTIAAFLGDYMGASTYDNSANGIASDLWVGFGVGCALSICFLYAIAVGNALRINTDNRKSWVTALGQWAYALAFFAVVGVSWFVSSLVYSLHDPSTE
jgi:hypothetical protein